MKARPFALSVLSLFSIAFVKIDCAQTEESYDLRQALESWSSEHKVVVTKSMQKALEWELSSTFTSNGLWGERLASADSTAENQRKDRESQRDYSWEQRRKVWSILGKYPTLHLVIEPVPPRDYSIEINGAIYPVTDASMYGVAPGSVKVRVYREGKSPCIWSGVATAPTQTVNCKF